MIVDTNLIAYRRVCYRAVVLNYTYIAQLHCCFVCVCVKKLVGRFHFGGVVLIITWNFDMSLCTAYQEDLIANEFLRVGPNCVNVSCQFPITSHSHRQAQQGNYYLHPVNSIELFPSHILHICIFLHLMNLVWWYNFTYFILFYWLGHTDTLLSYLIFHISILFAFDEFHLIKFFLTSFYLFRCSRC